MRIPESIVKGNEFNVPAVELLKMEVQLYLEKMHAGAAAILSERSEKVFSPAGLEKFFRDKERSEKVEQILQYLISFLYHIPDAVECRNEALNPVKQFREAIRHQVELLMADDVKKAVFYEINSRKSPIGGNVWDYRELTIEKNRELRDLLAMGAEEGAQAVFALSLVLEQLCLFWFEVKQGDLRRIRRSDIFMYKLAKILQDRYQQQKQKEPSSAK